MNKVSKAPATAENQPASLPTPQRSSCAFRPPPLAVDLDFEKLVKANPVLARQIKQLEATWCLRQRSVR